MSIGFHRALDALIMFAPVLVPVGVAIWTSAWAYHDARARGKSPLLVALLVLIAGWPLSLLLWLVFRPDDKRPPPFNLEDYRVQ